MADYQKMYDGLFNAVTDAISILQNAQYKAEDEFINQEEARIIPLDRHSEPKDS